MTSKDDTDILKYIDTLVTRNEISIALKLLEEIPFDNSKIDYSLFLKGLCYSKKSDPDYQKAFECFDKISKNYQTETTEYLKFVCKFYIGNYEDIVKYYLTNEGHFKTLTEDFQFLIAMAHEKLNLNTSAVKLYKEILKNNPLNRKVINNLCVMEMNQGNLQQMLMRMKLSSDSEPDSVELLNNYAILLIKHHKISEAFEVFENAMSHKDASQESKSKLTMNYLNTLAKYGNFEKAEKILKEKVTIENDDQPIVAFMLVDLYIRSNLGENAMNLLEELVSANPNKEGKPHEAQLQLNKMKEIAQNTLQELKEALLPPVINSSIHTKKKHSIRSNFEEKSLRVNLEEKGSFRANIEDSKMRQSIKSQNISFQKERHSQR